MLPHKGESVLPHKGESVLPHKGESVLPPPLVAEFADLRSKFPQTLILEWLAVSLPVQTEHSPVFPLKHIVPSLDVSLEKYCLLFRRGVSGIINDCASSPYPRRNDVLSTLHPFHQCFPFFLPNQLKTHSTILLATHTVQVYLMIQCLPRDDISCVKDTHPNVKLTLRQTLSPLN